MIENPVTPLAKNAGRVLQLEEVWRITDASGEFYFKSPHSLYVAEDGSVFIADKEQILRFSSAGHFLKNLFKKGQGPGEISDSFAYLVHGDQAFVKDYRQRRIFRMDFEGIFIDQLASEIGSSSLYGVRADDYVMMDPAWPAQEEQTGKLLPVLEQIKLVSRDGKVKKEVYAFQTRWFMSPRGASQWDPSITVISVDGRYLFGCHSTDYLIEVLDIDAGRIVRSFRRSYSRVKHVATAQDEELRRTFGSSINEYEWDVLDLFVDTNGLWVQTSTNDAAKGILYDIFDADGRFLDSFYLGRGRSLLKVKGKDLYSLEKDAEENRFVVKYRIRD